MMPYATNHGNHLDMPAAIQSRGVALGGKLGLLDERVGRITTGHDQLDEADAVIDRELGVLEQLVQLLLRGNTVALVLDSRILRLASQERQELLVVVPLNVVVLCIFSVDY